MDASTQVAAVVPSGRCHLQERGQRRRAVEQSGLVGAVRDRVNGPNVRAESGEGSLRNRRSPRFYLAC